jgi:hypothetical protein
MADRVINFEPAGPVAAAFMRSDAFVRLIVGPFGSGKTSAGVVEILRRAQMQAPGPDGVRRVRALIIRNTFADLKSTTLKSFEQWLPPEYGKLTLGTSPIVHRIVTADLDLELVFVPLDKDEDVRKLLSMEASFALIDEAREIPKSIFDALTGRVGRFPSRLQGGCTWSGIMLISNPSDTESWLYKLAENPPEGYEVFKQPSGRSPQAENLANLPAGYYQRIAGGKDPEWVKVYVDGEWGFLIEGQVVYPSFRDSVHVAPQRIEPVRGLGLMIGADWGLTPAAVIGQQLPDGRILIVDEFVCTDSGIIRFAESLTAYVRRHYADFDVISATGDPSGSARTADERTIFQIMSEHSAWRWRPARVNDVTTRIEAVSAALNRMVDGKPGFVLSPACATLRKGFAGGYHFQKIAAGNGSTFHETPRKNEYSHPHDALQYLVLAMGGADAVLNRDPQRRANRPRMADGIDYDILGHGERVLERSRVIVGNGRPAHLDQRDRRRDATTDDYSPFSSD